MLASKYELTKPAGFGGMAQLWSATNLSTGGAICIKVFIAGDADDEAVARFRREAKAAARLSHRAIVRVFDLVELTVKGELSSGPNPYALAITMELLQGQTLGDFIAKKGKLPVEQALDIVLPVCSALAYAHRSNIVHRDVKPDNIFLAEDSDGQIEPKVLDFGVSKMRGHEIGPLTHQGVMLGTPTFMSPEQARGAQDVNPRSDVFSVGILLHVLITGKNPFEGKKFVDTVKNIREMPAPVIDGIPDALAKVIDKALTKEAARRYADAGELGQALRAASGRSGGAESGAAIASSPKAPDSARDVAPLGGDSIITVPPASQGQEEPAPTMDPKDEDDDDHAHVDGRDERRALVAKARASQRGAAVAAVQAEIEDAQADSVAGERLQAAAEARKRAIKIVGGVLGVAVVIMVAAFLRSPDGSTSDGAKSPGTSGTSPTVTPPASETAAPSASATTSASSAPAVPASASAAPSASVAPTTSAALSAAPTGTTTAPVAPAVTGVVGTGAPPAASDRKIDVPSLQGAATSTASSPAVTVTVTATAVPPAPTAPPAPPPPAPTAAPAPAPTGSGSIVRDPGF